MFILIFDGDAKMVCLIQLDGNGFKAIPGRFMYPILVHLQKERKYR